MSEHELCDTCRCMQELAEDDTLQCNECKLNAKIAELEAENKRLRDKFAMVRKSIGLWYDTSEKNHINDAYESAIIRNLPTERNIERREG